MKLLLREYDDKYYVWKDGYVQNGVYYISDKAHDISINQNCILAIKDDERTGYVVCASCGAVIKNTPEDIEKHFTDREKSRDCTSCEYLRLDKGYRINRKVEKNEDGSYNVTDTTQATLTCGKSYYYNRPRIESTDAKNNCHFYLCRKAGVTQINDVFIMYPGLFDKQITVDVLNKKKMVYERTQNDHFEYDLKCRGTVKACVNELGIIDHFKIYFRYRVVKVYYSDKYDMLFYDSNGHYTTEIPYGITDAKCNQAKEKISALYKEAAKK